MDPVAVLTPMQVIGMKALTVGLNFLYCFLGGLLLLFFMNMGWKFMDKITPYDTQKELEDNNTAVGIVVGSIFLALGIGVAIVVGMSLN
jgi:uncharacterized membrane protein YjfL (UPF0719 family)